MHPEFLRVGEFTIYWYGVMAAAGVFASSWLFQRYALREGYSHATISSLILWTVVAGVIGGRFLHIAAQFSYYRRHLLEIVMIRNGGLAIQGAILAALVFIAVYGRARRLHVLKTLDLVAMVTPVGQAFGRIGCFLNGCCHGKPVTGRIPGVSFPFVEGSVHAVQLYYAAADLALFLVLRLFYREKEKDGEILSLYLIFFGVIRYALDFLRGDLAPTALGLSTTQIFGIIIFFIGGFWFSSLMLREER